MSTEPKLDLTLRHMGGSSRPCEVMSIENKASRRGTVQVTSIRVRWGLAGVYAVNPHTGAVENLKGWSALVDDCNAVIAAWTQAKAGAKAP